MPALGALTHILFDLDGTVVNSAPVILEIINQMRIRRGYDVISIDDVVPVMGLAGEQLIALLLGPASKDLKQDAVEFRSYYATSDTPSDSLYPGVVDTLTYLHRKGYKLSICSNKPNQLCAKVLSDLSILHYFDVIVGGENTSKPSVEHLDITLDKLQTSKDSCCYIGDSAIDLEFTQKSNIPFVYASFGYGDLDNLPSNCYTINSFNDLTTLF